MLYVSIIKRVIQEYLLNDKISVNDNYLDTSLNLFYSYSIPTPGGGRIDDYIDVGKNWSTNNEFSYISFRKKTNNGYILAWLKVHADTSNEYLIYLEGCKFYNNQDEVVIDEQNIFNILEFSIFGHNT